MQKDLYTSEGIYLKTVCYVSQSDTRDNGALTCSSFEMQLANPDDVPESLGALIAFTNEAVPYTAGAAAWVGGDKNGQCSILSWVSASNFERQWIPCESNLGVICEFDSKFTKSRVFEDLTKFLNLESTRITIVSNNLSNNMIRKSCLLKYCLFHVIVVFGNFQHVFSQKNKF
jgi:hypothetical protein